MTQDSTFAPQVRTMHTGETRAIAVSFLGKLDSGELLTGTPTVAEETTTDLTLASKALNTAPLTIVDDSVVASQAVQFTVTGGTTGVEYTVKITVGTDASPAQTLVERVRINFA